MFKSTIFIIGIFGIFGNNLVDNFYCSNDMDCALAGICNKKTLKCDCFSGFLPPDCGALDLKKALRNGGLRPKNYTTWGGSPIKVNKTYHLYASLNLFGSVETWPNSSVIVHATSKSAAGPYKQEAIILGPRPNFFDGDALQNPMAIILHDGTIALYYIGMTCRMSNFGYNSADCEDSANSSIGVAHAPSPYGPWTRLDLPILSSMLPINHEGDALANPTAYQEDDDSILIAFRGRHDQVLPLATADNWAGPYKRLFAPGSSIYNSGCFKQMCNDTVCFDKTHSEQLVGNVRDISRPAVGPFECLEDPYIFRIKSGSYHMIMHNQGRPGFVGAHGFSKDGKNWSLSPTPAYMPNVAFDDGSIAWLMRREEPKLLIEEGFATHLFNAACESTPECGYIISVPLEPIELW